MVTTVAGDGGAAVPVQFAKRCTAARSLEGSVSRTSRGQMMFRPAQLALGQSAPSG